MCTDYRENQPVKQLYSVYGGLVWAEQCLCPQPNRSHAFLGVQRRQQVLLAQELQGEVDQQPSYGLQLFSGLFEVCVTKALLGSVLLQLSCVVHSVVGQTFEDLDVGYELIYIYFYLNAINCVVEKVEMCLTLASLL